MAVSNFGVRGEVLSIGHRGNSLFAPENTLAAFTAAQGKADLVETDGRVSSDGHLVIMHDATVDRTTDGTGAVSSRTLVQLKLLDAGSWFTANFVGERIPTLEEMITTTLPFATPLIERKDGTASIYVDELRRLGVVTNVILQSFDWDFLAAVHALEPNLRLGALGSGTLTSVTLSNIINSGATIVAWEKALITPGVISAVHNAGLALYVWTVDGPEIQNFIDLGVDGIISNDPGMVKELRQTPTSSLTEFGDRLVAYWSMDDGLTNPWTATVSDSQGTNAGTLVRADGLSHWFGLGTAKLGGCLQVDALNASVTMPQTGSLDINTNQLTISAWIRLPNLPSQLATSFGSIFDSTTDCYVLYLDRANKELRFKVTDTNGHAARPGIPETLLPTNQWCHVAATFSGLAGPASGQAIIYLNGVPKDVHTGNDSSSPFGLTGNVQPGQSAAMGREGPGGGNYFTGFVDDVALWRRALLPTEVARIFQSGQAGLSLADLLALPSPLLQITSIGLTPSGTGLEICFHNSGAWQSFQLYCSTNLAGPYPLVPSVVAVSLGGGDHRFDYALPGRTVEFFRIKGF